MLTTAVAKNGCCPVDIGETTKADAAKPTIPIAPLPRDDDTRMRAASLEGASPEAYKWPCRSSTRAQRNDQESPFKSRLAALIVVSLMRQLTWTHFIALMPLKNPLQRDFSAAATSGTR
jgi:hypothetical protein